MSQKIYHILVKHHYEAEDLLRKLKEGSTFESLALKSSLCSSKLQGGCLGDLSKKWHLVDPEFKEACDQLNINEISKPVRSSFGYHLILKK